MCCPLSNLKNVFIVLRWFQPISKSIKVKICVTWIYIAIIMQSKKKKFFLLDFSGNCKLIDVHLCQQIIRIYAVQTYLFILIKQCFLYQNVFSVALKCRLRIWLKIVKTILIYICASRSRDPRLKLPPISGSWSINAL